MAWIEFGDVYGCAVVVPGCELAAGEGFADDLRDGVGDECPKSEPVVGRRGGDEPRAKLPPQVRIAAQRELDRYAFEQRADRARVHRRRALNPERRTDLLIYSFVDRNEQYLVDAGLGGRDGLDGHRDGIGARPSEDTHADQWECPAAGAEFVGDLKGPLVTGHQQGTVALPGVVVRADRVDDPPGGQMACRSPPGIAGGKAVRKPGDAVTQDTRAAAAMDRAV